MQSHTSNPPVSPNRLANWLTHLSAQAFVESADSSASTQPPITTFSGFYRVLVDFGTRFSLQTLNTFNPNNLSILQSILRRLDDAVNGRFYTATELQTLIRAQQLRSQTNPSFEQLRQMKDGVAVSLKQKKICQSHCRI